VNAYVYVQMMWMPDKVGNRPDILATTGDYLRLWEVNYSGDGGGSRGTGCNVQLMKLLNNNKNSEFCAPLTSFDWNDTGVCVCGGGGMGGGKGGGGGGNVVCDVRL